MLPTVHLDNQSNLHTKEIDHERAQRLLATELCACQLAATQMEPETGFRLSLLPSQIPGAASLFADERLHGFPIMHSVRLERNGQYRGKVAVSSPSPVALSHPGEGNFWTHLHCPARNVSHQLFKRSRGFLKARRTDVSGMKITRVDVTPFSIPFRRPLVLAGAEVPARHGLLIELGADDGTIGIGEASPHPAADAEVLEGMTGAIARIGTSLIAAGTVNLQAPPPQFAAVGAGAARAGLEMAWFDLAGQAAGRRVADLLGGARQARIPVNAMMDQVDPSEAAVAAQHAVGMGYRCLKLKVIPHNVAAAVAQVEAVHATLGSGVSIRVDANGGWTVEEAIDAIPRLAVYGIEYVEQPVVEIADMAVVRAAVATPLAADECVSDVASVHRIAELGAADIVIVKPTLLGLHTAAAVVRAAHECGLGAVVTSTLDTSVGIAAALHLAATLPDPIPACGLATAPLLTGDLVHDPLVPTNGELCLPPEPGLGVRLDHEALRRWRSAEPRRSCRQQTERR